MYENFAYNIVNSTFVLDNERNAVVVPPRFYQIMGSDKTRKCLQLSTAKQNLLGGTNAGVFGNSLVFYDGIPIVEHDVLLNLTKPEKRSKRTEIRFGDVFGNAREPHRFDKQSENDSNYVDNEDACRMTDGSNDTFVLRIT